MTNTDHISQSLETVFWVKILKFFDADPGWKNSDLGWKKSGSEIRDKHPGSPTLEILKYIFLPFSLLAARIYNTVVSKMQ
jgi:hypothetical protein